MSGEFNLSADELESILEKLPKDKIYEDLLNLYEVNDKQLDNPELIMSKLEYIYNFKQPLDQELLTSTEIIVRSHILMLEFIQHSIASD